MTINSKPLTMATTLEEIVGYAVEGYEAGQPTAVFQSVAFPVGGGKPLLITVAMTVEPYDGRPLLSGAGGLTKQ